MYRKNILIVSSEYPPQPGGIGNHAYNLASQLSLNNYSVTVLTDQRSIQGKPESEFDKQCNHRVIRVKRYKLRWRMYFLRYIKWLKFSRNMDVVIASGKFSLWMVASGKINAQKKTIAVIHGTEVNFRNKALNNSIIHSLRKFDEVIAVSNFTKKLVLGNKIYRIKVIPNGINKELISQKIKTDFPLEGKPALITVGRLSERKGQKMVIQSITELLTDYPKLVYHCVGIIGDNSYKELIQELGLESHVILHGVVSDEKLASYLNQCDIFLMTSQTTGEGDVEGFGIAIIEANAFGKPAIGTSNSGIEDAIMNGKTGLLIAQNDGSELVIAIRTILDNYSSFGNHALEWSHKFHWDKIIDKYIAVIEN